MLLDMLKIDLGIMSTAYDDRLGQYILSAQERIEREGVKDLDLDASMEDMQLVVMYAAWLWRKRDNMEAMPRMIRYALNNRLFAQKARV